MAFLKKSFKKFGHEDIRTEYFATDNNHKAPDTLLSAGTVIEFDSTSKKAQACAVTAAAANGIPTQAEIDTATASKITSTTINNTVFLLAEDFHSNDNGFVYYIVDNTNNLEDRA